MTRIAMRVVPIAVLAFSVQGEASQLANVRVTIEHVGEAPGHLFVGEPLQLNVTTVNAGSEPLTGYFKAFASSPSVTFYVQRAGGALLRMPGPSDRQKPGMTICSFRTQQVLAAGGSLRNEVQFLLDDRTNAPWLADEGEYEVSVALRPFDGVSTEEVRSEPARISVSWPPDRLRDAFEAYRSSRMMEFVSDVSARLSEDPRAAMAAESFLAEYAETPYGRHVSNALIKGLRMRSGNNELTASEREVYKRVTKEIAGGR